MGHPVCQDEDGVAIGQQKLASLWDQKEGEGLKRLGPSEDGPQGEVIFTYPVVETCHVCVHINDIIIKCGCAVNTAPRHQT